jgi:hypothetical protein
MYFYFIGIPFFKHFWLPWFPKWMTGYFYEPEPVMVGPDLEPSNYWMGWGYTLAKWAFYAACLMTAMMLFIWQKQESILYVPSQPI